MQISSRFKIVRRVKMRRWLASLLIGVLANGLAWADRPTWKFDFEPSTSPDTAEGYISVTELTNYDPNVGYGWTNPDDPRVANQDSAWAVGYNVALRDAIQTKDWTWAGGGDGDKFQVDVPNGDYLVTYYGGLGYWDLWMRFNINGVDYRFNSDTNPTAVDPPGAPLYAYDALNDVWRLIDDEVDLRKGSYDSIRVFGWNNTPQYDKRSEFLVLKQGLVTVTDGKILAMPFGGSSNAYAYIAALIIEAANPASCAEVQDWGLSLQADLNGDCYVNWQDFTLFASQWLFCNDPEDPNCTTNW